jgi:hypothetical protein
MSVLARASGPSLSATTALLEAMHLMLPSPIPGCGRHLTRSMREREMSINPSTLNTPYHPSISADHHRWTIINTNLEPVLGLLEPNHEHRDGRQQGFILLSMTSTQWNRSIEFRIMGRTRNGTEGLKRAGDRMMYEAGDEVLYCHR